MQREADDNYGIFIFFKIYTREVIIGLSYGGWGGGGGVVRLFVVRSIYTNRIDKLYSRGRPTVQLFCTYSMI
jgi:hypothetical protein